MTETPKHTEDPAAENTTEAAVTTVDQMDVGSMKMGKVGERRVVVIRSASGFHALDNACPHQGYGLATGSLDGELVTCQWHNWKFRVTDGSCVIGQEDVACHPVRVEGNDVIVSVTEETDEEKRAALWPSLQRGLERDYRGQIARDTARLLQAGAAPDDIVAAGLRYGLPRSEWGMGHDMAVSADLMTLADNYDGIEKTLPLTHALTGFSESNRDRSPHEVPSYEPALPDRATFVAAIEAEDAALAVNTVRALLASPDRPAVITEAKRWFIDAVSQHHYNFGHGAIYTQKVFTIIERLPELTDLLLTELALTFVYGTREDTLPYMRKTKHAIDAVDVDALSHAASFRETGWSDAEDHVVNLLLDSAETPIAALVDAAHAGAGVEGLINAISLAASTRLLRYDLEVERDHTESFSWLDITHALTYVNAARWAWAANPGPEAARLVLFTAFMAFDSGRAERRIRRLDLALPTPAKGDIAQAILEQRPNDAVAHVLAADPDAAGDQLEAMSMEDLGGSFIVMAHLVKTSVAAREEASATESMLPLAAAARYLASVRAERFVTAEVREAIDFVQTGRPPVR